MAETDVLRSDGVQTIRLPKDVALPDKVDRVQIRRLGDSLIISPLKQSWSEWFKFHKATDDFMSDRSQLEFEHREDM